MSSISKDRDLRVPVPSKRLNLVLLHGLFGSLSNWDSVTRAFSDRHNIYIPKLPILQQSFAVSPMENLVLYLEHYIEENHIAHPVLIGNSLGGHLALLYSLKGQHRVWGLVLTGSSGLFENTLMDHFPRTRDYSYIKSKVREVFYKKEAVDEELINKVFSCIQNKKNVLSIIRVAKDAKRQNLKKELPNIEIPVQLIWGMQDVVTPVSVAEEFYLLLPSSRLCLINECGHVPMMEQPDQFNNLMDEFISRKIINDKETRTQKNLNSFNRTIAIS
ncbi:alpha/beta hydrolase [Galbibacter sp. PAP.153]|uniref:alpha/beta fold hydrolase n=1 Tax=Galbibacter sp. PAP.153 TaxID=3104623 RepID=UPI00300A1A52